MAHDDPVKQQAVDWAIRTGEPEFDDWDGFTAWLEGDPARSVAYDRVMAATAEAAAADALFRPPANNEEKLPSRPQRRWAGWAVAACLLVALIGFWPLRDTSYAVVTAPGEIRTVALGDGSTITLAGGTTIVLDRSDPREARLEAGQALFTIRHDDATPFRLEVGEDTLVDLGTVFDVRLTTELTSVAVSEGAVLFNPGQQDVLLAPGDMLSSPVGSADYEVRRIALDEVGEWREGRLTFQDATLAEVAAELTRATGTVFDASPAAASARFSGSILLGPLRADPQAVGPLLGARVHSRGQGWVIEAP